MSSEIRKAAVLLSNLPSEAKAHLLSMLEPRLAAAVAVQIAELGRVGHDEARIAADCFMTAMLPDIDNDDVHPADANPTDIRPTANLLDTVSDRQLLSILIEEQPATIAAMLQAMPEARAARLMTLLPQPLRLAVVRRLATIGPVASEVVRDIEWTIVERLAAASVPYAPIDYSIFRLATILEQADFHTRHELLSRLSWEDPHLATALCRLLRIFCEIEERESRVMHYEGKQVRAAA